MWSPPGPRCYKEVKGPLQTASHPRQWKNTISQGSYPYKVGNSWLKSPDSKISWQDDFLQGAGQEDWEKCLDS